MKKSVFIFGFLMIVNLVFSQSNADKSNDNTHEVKVKQIPWKMMSTSDESIPTPMLHLSEKDTNPKSKPTSKNIQKKQGNAKNDHKSQTQQVVEKSTIKDDKSVVSAGSEMNESPVMIENPVEKPDTEAKFPLYNGGYLKYFQENFKYPPRCLEDGLSGKVVLRFVVDVKGRVRNISCVEETNSCPEFTKEAIRVLMKSPNWYPAIKNGRYVNSWMQIPVSFVLN